MRKVLAFLAATLILIPSATTFAQQNTRSSEKERPRLYLGVVGMLNMSSFDFSSDNDISKLEDSTQHKVGYGGGLRAIYEFTPNIGIQPEILFKQYGATLDADLGIFGTLDGSMTTNYLHIPLLARLALPLADNAITPKIVLGPTVSYYLSGEGDIEGYSGDIDEGDVNRFDFGLAAGVGVDAGVGPGSLSFDARYDRSLTAFNKSKSGDGGLMMFNTGFSFLVGYNHAF